MAKAKQAAVARDSVAVAALKDVHIEGTLYRVGAVVVLPAALAAAHADAGDVDPHPAAVEHLRSAGAPEHDHKG